MVSTLITISIVGVIGAIGEKIIDDDGTKKAIEIGTIGIMGALSVGFIVNLMKEVIKVI